LDEWSEAEIQVSKQLVGAVFFWLFLMPTMLRSAESRDAEFVARRHSLLRSYGTYSGAIRTPDGRIDQPRLLTELGELHANTYNWLIAGSENDWQDLDEFLPAAKKKGIRVWVTVMPPSESPPRTKRFSEPFRLDYEKWAAELAALSAREPALVAWSIDDFAHNLKTFTPERMGTIIATQRKQNPKFAFAPCVYFNQATPALAKAYREFIDGILFPYRSDSTKPGLIDPSQVAPEVNALKERLGSEFPVIVDVYATRHSQLGSSTAEYVEQVMTLAHPVADGVHIYCHQNQHNPKELEKYKVIERVMSSWK